MSNAHPLWRCLALYREMPYRFSLTAAIFIVANLSMAWQQWLSGKIFHEIQTGHAIRHLADGSIDFSIIAFWLGLFLALASARGVLQYLGGIMALTIGQELLFIIRERIMTKVQQLDLAYHWKHGMGEIVTRTTRDADKVRDALINFWRQVFETALAVIAAIGLMCWYSPWLGIVPLGLTLTGISIFLLQTDRLVTLDRAVGDAYDRVNQDLSEGINGVRVIKSFALEQQRIAIFNAHINVFVQQARTALAYATSHIPIPQIIVALSHVWILAFGSWLVQQGRLNVGELVASLLVANILVFRIEGVGRVMQIFADARSSAARIWELLDAQPGIVSGSEPVPTGQLGLRLQNVSVHAPGSPNPILQDCSLNIAPGEIIAIVGVTGSGKSTLAASLSRLLDIDEGQLLVGSDQAGWKNIKKLDLHALRRKIHVVPQESFLFSDTLEANLRLANPAASDEQLHEALELASASEILTEDGFAARLGDRGITLSGGQRQRLSLARALLSEPAVLVLDDSTSALDTLTERRVLNNIRALRSASGQGTTVVLIASKISTILLADRVALLSGGHIAAEGTHTDLSRDSAEYRSLLGIGDHQHG